MELNLLEKNLDNNIESVTSEKQNNFLNSTLGKVIDKGINLGIRALLPNIIEDQVIEIKDSLIKGGLGAGVKQAITSAIDLGKSTLGVFTGKFENINQARTAVKNGGIIDGISSVLDFAVNKTVKNGAISNNIGKVIKKGKNAILDAVDSNIENEFNEQINSIEKIEKYTNNWKEYYNNKDFNGMEREYEKIEEKIDKVLPLESTINQARKLENIHQLIKNKGKDFKLSKEELELAKKLT